MVRHSRLESAGGTLVHTRFGSIERFVFPGIGLSWMDNAPEEQTIRRKEASAIGLLSLTKVYRGWTIHRNSKPPAEGDLKTEATCQLRAALPMER
jgi:hypothetical protein